MQPSPNLAIVATIQQAITTLLTTYEPEFLRFGYTLFIAFATILLAHIFERFGYAPCPLCLQERYAYYFGVPALIIAFFAARAESFTLTRIVLALVALAFLVNAGIGVYHSGIDVERI